jgi:hypothetical protein
LKQRNIAAAALILEAGWNKRQPTAVVKIFRPELPIDP